MAGRLLADRQGEQAERISAEIVRQSLEHQMILQENAERKWQKCHHYLVELLRSLDSDYYDACQKSGRSPDQFADDNLHQLIDMRIRVLQKNLIQSTRPDNSEELQEQLKESIRELQKAGEEEQRLSGVIGQLQEENQRLITHLQAVKQVKREPDIATTKNMEPRNEAAVNPKVVQPNNIEPDWMRSWRGGRAFSKEAEAVILMGTTGKSLRPTIVDLLAKELSLAPTNSSLSEAISRLLSIDAEGGLIELLDDFIRQGASTGGNHPDVLRLTERGRMAYTFLTGKQPQESEYDRLLRKHKSPEHTVLNIQAAEALAEYGGYEILEQAPDIQLPDGSVFIPDLVAMDKRTGEMIFVEVERDVAKDRTVRKRKWRNVMEASNGNIYVFCDNIGCERSIQTEINRSLEEAKFNSHLTNLNSLRKGKRAPDGGIWLSVRKMR
jgi:hypothetical protein